MPFHGLFPFAARRADEHRATGKFARQFDGSILARLQLYAIDDGAGHRPAAVDFEAQAALAKPQICRDRRAAGIKRRTDHDRAAFEIDSQIMPHDKERDLTGSPANQAAGFIEGSNRRNFLEQETGAPALAGVQPFKRAAAAVEEAAPRAGRGG